jgi:CBS domain-containing protein
MPERLRYVEAKQRGAGMLRAKDIMSHEVVTVSPGTEIVEVARILLEKQLNGLPVVDSRGRVAGIVCRSDLIAQQKKIPLPSVFNLLDTLIPIVSPAKIEKEFQKISATTAEGAMTPNPATVAPDTPLEDIAALMVNKNFHTLPVVEEGKLVGVIGMEDILRTLMPGGAKARGEE